MEGVVCFVGGEIGVKEWVLVGVLGGLDLGCVVFGRCYFVFLGGGI